MYRRSNHSLAATLPCEILLHIFFDAVPASYEYDSSIVQGPNSSWQRLSRRTKKSLTLVCRAWYGPATEVLYHEVVLRRASEVQRLASILRGYASSRGANGAASPATQGQCDVAVLIRRLQIDAFLVLLEDANALKRDLACIFRRCTRLVAFHFYSSSAIAHADHINPDQTDYALTECTTLWLFPNIWRIHEVQQRQHSQQNPEDELRDAFRVLSRSGLREIDLLSSDPTDRCWTGRLFMEHIHTALPVAASTLVSLRLGRVFASPHPDMLNIPASSLVFNVLKELHVFYGILDLMPYLCRVWVLPRLEKLTLLELESWPTHPGELIRVHGRHLRYLHIYPALLGCPDSGFTYDDAVLQLADTCPELEHVVLSRKPDRPLALRHPALRYIDVWATETGFEDHAHIPTDISSRLRASVVDESRAQPLPNLRGVRFLLAARDAAHLPSTNLAPERHVDWPVVCHPTAFDGSDADVFFHIFMSNWAVQTRWGVLSMTRALCLRRTAVTEDTESWLSVGSEGVESGEELLVEVVDYDLELPDEMEPDEDMLKAVLDEQGVVHCAEDSDGEYVPYDDGTSSTGSSYSGSDAGVEDDFP